MFVNIHCHSEHSALDGLSTAEEMAALAAEMGQTAMAITDHGVVAGHPAFQAACDEHGIRPLFGEECYLVGDRTDRSPEVRNDYWHLILIAATDEGLRNLWAASTESFATGKYYRPRMDWDVLARHSEGVIATTGCLRGPLAHPYLAGDSDRAIANLERLCDIFGDRLYVEIQTNQLPDQVRVNEWLVCLAREVELPLLAACDSHYPRKSDADAHAVWLAVQTTKDTADDSGLFAGQQDYHLHSEAEVREALSALPDDVVEEAVANTVVLADRCDARVAKTESNPIYSIETADPPTADDDLLYEVCLRRWDERTRGKSHSQDDYRDRFEREYDMLVEKRFSGYFLLVWDMVSYAKSQGILMSPGRGSGVGSLVAYLLGITELDPVEYDILFERFMTKGRVELPDFDCVAGTTELHRDGPGDRSVAFLYALLHGRLDAVEGECEVCGEPMESIKRGYMGNPPEWLCKQCYKRRHHLRSVGLPSILGRNVVGRLSNQPLVDIFYKGVRDTFRITVSDGRFIESTPEHKHLTSSGWMEARDIHPGDLMVLMDDRGRRASHTDNLGAGTKARLVERAAGACERCFKRAPENESWLGQFEVAHLDYSTKNIDNMLFLCVGCHREMDAQLGTPVVFRPVVSVEGVGDQPVYDVVMGNEDHSWIANGFVTHNCDFPSSKKREMSDYVSRRWGADHTAIVGTHQRLKNKAVFKDVSRAISSRLPQGYFPQVEEITKIVDAAQADTAGLGLSFGDLLDRAEDELASYRKAMPELFSYAERLVGRLRTYGSHAAGVIISTEGAVTENLPLRDSKDGMVAQFDLEVLEELGYVKFDLLNLRNLDTIQETIDSIEVHTGVRVDPYTFTDELADPQVFAAFSRGDTLGFFQVETHLGTRLCVDYQPTSLVELAHIGALVRPGPQRSGITEEYLNRRRSGCVESQPDSRLEDILAPTQSLMIFQDQILQICFRLADYTDVEADHVRKILGKKKPEEAKIEGDKFVSQCCANDVEEQVARNLWNTMERFALYGFNFGHSMGYGLLSYWCAWFATHYPLYFITALLSTVKDESIPSCVTEAQRLGYRVLPPDINASGRGFTVDPDNLAIRYGLESVKGLGPAAVEAIFENRPFVDWEDFRARKGAKVNVGYVKVLNAVGALESIAGHRRWIEQYLELEALPSGQRCIHYDEHADNHGLPCSFDWESLPPAVGRTGKPLKKQPGPPKKCSRACKQFVPLQSPSASEVEPYTAQQQGRIEADVLGLSLSYSPFADIPADIRAEVSTAHDVAYGTDGRYLCLGVLSDVCTFADRRDRPMAFVTLSTERGSMRVTVFARQYTTFRTELVEGALVVCSVTHNDRGQVLDSLDRIDAEETAHV